MVLLLQVIVCFILLADLRDDKQFFIDHPGASPISTAQVRVSGLSAQLKLSFFFLSRALLLISILACLKGEELKKTIAASAYIECSSKTQQVCSFSILNFLS